MDIQQSLLQLQTPCFVVEQEEMERSVVGFRNALNRRFERSIVGYSVKTCSLPWCLREAARLGCYAEVVSSDEYELALLCGVSKNRIVYNGPMKSEQTFIDALLHGAIVNIETHRELQWLSKLPKDAIFDVGVRLNIDISAVSPKDAIGGGG